MVTTFVTSEATSAGEPAAVAPDKVKQHYQHLNVFVRTCGCQFNIQYQNFKYSEMFDQIQNLSRLPWKSNKI